MKDVDRVTDTLNSDEDSELTPEAVKAGARAILAWNPEFDDAEYCAERVYYAMTDIMRTHEPSGGLSSD